MNKEKYLPEVQKKIDALDIYYEIDETMTSFNILHMYPKELAYPNGFIDARFFDLIIFDNVKRTKRIIKGRDGLNFYNTIDPKLIRIFADGSTVIEFNSHRTVDIFQCVEIQ